MKKYTLSIEITNEGEIRSTESYAGLGIHEVIGLLEMQQQATLRKLNQTRVDMQAPYNEDDSN